MTLPLNLATLAFEVGSLPVAPTPPQFANFAVQALVDEAELTPKPGLVDRRGSGAHRDLDLAALLRSAESLRATFATMAKVSLAPVSDRSLRARLAVVGRHGEQEMMAATGGSNAHRGAIWALGLLIAGAVIDGAGGATAIAARAASIARHPDRFAPNPASNGARVSARYGVSGARGEATAGFPHVVNIGLPVLRSGRLKGLSEDEARIDALLAVMASLDDTCLLHRGGQPALDAAKTGARNVLAAGGVGASAGRAALTTLERRMLDLNASPGGAADVLAATLFLDRIDAFHAGFCDSMPMRR
jgi:triphosphoribosyl-dephospho-CoA synthase